MTESQIFQPSWPYFRHDNNLNSILDNVREDGFCGGGEYTCYPLPTLMEESYLETSMLQERCANFPVHLDGDMDITTEDVLVYFEDPISIDGQITDVSMSPEESKGGNCIHSCHQISMPSSSMRSSHAASLDVTSMPSSLVLPAEGVELDNELAAFHLLMAYAEAMEMGQEELAEVIAKRISEKVSPVGDTVERLLYYMFHALDKQSDYLKQESAKNFYQAFKAFYQIFPNGKFAHFAANLAILESLPDDADTIRIFDFDIGEGIQWASLIEAIGHQCREVTLTSVKFAEGEDAAMDANPLTMWRFEDAKKQLSDYARSYGLKLMVDEVELADLVGELKNISNRKQGSSGRRQFLVFNCMVGLPHMGRVRSRRDVFEFLQASQSFLQLVHASAACGNYKGGVITFGDGDAWEKVRNTSTYGSFLDGNMAHYQALLESIKLNFPSHLGEARTAMENLFVAPSVSSLAWAEKWEERKRYGQLELGFGLEGLKLSRESLMEAKEVVREGESLYGVRMQGESHNEMVMDWRGTPMVRVSCWRS
ncbi:unnamed protein product [Coffea canephora]|uniref:Uncharacterized protein n=1 Tax=Coffea canephora TaxID=49390 RepID=A0A068UE03_COFCA|nr:unnamed protein product [Coffea canephora]